MGFETRTVSKFNLELVARWCEGVMITEIDPFDSTKTNPAFNFQAGEEIKRAHIGDTIIKNADGTFQLWEGQPL